MNSVFRGQVPGCRWCPGSGRGAGGAAGALLRESARPDSGRCEGARSARTTPRRKGRKRPGGSGAAVPRCRVSGSGVTPVAPVQTCGTRDAFRPLKGGRWGFSFTPHLCVSARSAINVEIEPFSGVDFDTTSCVSENHLRVRRERSA